MPIHILILLATSIYLFVGCSSKEYYKPKVELSGEFSLSGKLPSEIISTNGDGALLEDAYIVTDKVENYKLKDGYTFLVKSSDYIISSNIEGKLYFKATDSSLKDKELDLKKTVATLNLDKNILAVLFADNEIALYDFTTEELLFKESGSKVSAIDNRVVKPFFLNELVIFLTLDGKVTIVSSRDKEVLRSSIISSEPNFNNVIYFNVNNNKLLAATTYKLLVIGEDEKRESLEMRDVIFNDEGIYVTTKQGKVMLLTPELKVKREMKFPFAHFLGMVVGEKIYLLEKEGYMIAIEKDFSSYKVYEVDMDDGYVYVNSDTFYFDDKYIKIAKDK